MADPLGIIISSTHLIFLVFFILSGKNPSVNIIWKIEGHWKIIVTFQNLGVMGRFSDGGKYPDDIVEGALSKVRQIRIADFIKEVVATRRWIETSDV